MLVPINPPKNKKWFLSNCSDQVNLLDCGLNIPHSPSLRCNPSLLRVKLSNHHTAKCQFGPVVRRHAGKQTDAGLILLWLSFSFKSCGSWTLSDWDFVPPQGISKWLAALPVFSSRSHPGGDGVVLGTVYFPTPSPPPPPPAPPPQPPQLLGPPSLPGTLYRQLNSAFDKSSSQMHILVEGMAISFVVVVVAVVVSFFVVLFLVVVVLFFSDRTRLSIVCLQIMLWFCSRVRPDEHPHLERDLILQVLMLCIGF